MFKQAFIVLLLALGWQAAHSQQKYTIKLLTANSPVKSIRGMSVVSDRIIWISGTGGMVGKSADGGQTWQWIQVPGCDSCDWRDITAFSERRALVVNAGEPAHIFLTTDGGHTWERVYFNDTKGIFFDGMDFWNEQEGMAVGDPLNGRFMLIRTRNGGRRWDTLPPSQRPEAAEGEAIFAASGTGIRALSGGKACFVTGGARSRCFQWDGRRWQSYELPLVQGSPSTGAFSVAFRNAREGVAVGGDYRNDTLRQSNCLLTKDGGQTWTAPALPPAGFRSCVEYFGPQLLIATGTSGTDVSTDGGLHWQPVSPQGFHVAAIAPGGNTVFLAGSGGRIAKLTTDH